MVVESAPYRRIDVTRLEAGERARHPPLHIRWWIVPLAAMFSSAQAVLNLTVEARGAAYYLINDQVPALTFGLFFLFCLLLNPLLRLIGLVRPLNRAELMAVFAAVFVSAGISTVGLVNSLIPLMVAPFNPQWNTPQREWATAVIPYLNKRLFIADPEVLHQFRAGFDTRAGLWDRIPWLVWAKPLGLWLIFIFAIYMVFYGLSILVYDSWARREKIVFPLARLPGYLMHDEDAPPGTLSSTVRNPLFWIGFALVGLILLYNAGVRFGWFGSLETLNLSVPRDKLIALLSNSVFKGIADKANYRFAVTISFTAVGIGYLLPLEISRSLWGYYLFSILLFLVAIWFAVASSVASFPSDEMWQNNFVSSLGAGGLLAYAGACLTKLLAEKWAQVRAAGSRRGKWEALRSSSGGAVLFLLAIAVALGWLWWCGIPFGWSVGFLAVVVLVTVGLMRVVAEGGVHVLSIHTGPFHLARAVGMVKLIPAVALAPLLPIYAALVHNPRVSMAPAALNSFKMQEDARASRFRFHLIVIVSILATVAVSCAAILYLTYANGADRTKIWYFTHAPMGLMDNTKRLVAGDFDVVGGRQWIFYLAGAAWVVLSIVARRRMFWWPHPIGFVMLSNFIMRELWLSLLIAWFCKRMAVKYGGRHMFARIRPLFIGLLVGELTSSFLIKWLLNPPQLQ